MQMLEENKKVVNIMANAGVALATLLLALTVAACSSGGSDHPFDNSDSTFIGTVIISGAPLADLAAPDTTGAQDELKWSARLIDPTEDVDSIEISNGDTALPALETGLDGEFLLQIDLLPVADLAGSGASVTPVTVEVPVLLDPAIDTVIHVLIEVLMPNTASRVVSQQGTYQLRLQYTEQGARQHTGLVGIDFQSRQLYRDSNGNGRLDDETAMMDSDLNGRPDDAGGSGGGGNSGSRFELSGTVDSVDAESREITVAGRALKVNMMSVITGSGGNSITLEQIPPGSSVSVIGHESRGGIQFADYVVVEAG